MVDYRFYTDSYYGTKIPEKAFPGALLRAKAELGRFCRIYTVAPYGPEAEAMALCAMAEAAYELSRRGEGVTFAGAGGVSVRYDGPRRWRRAMYEAATTYLEVCRSRKL